MRQELFFLDNNIPTFELEIIKHLLMNHRKISVFQNVTSYEPSGWEHLISSLKLASQTAKPVLVGWNSGASLSERSKTWDIFMQDVPSYIEPLIVLYDNYLDKGEDKELPLLIQLANYLNVTPTHKQLMIAYYDIFSLNDFLEKGLSIQSVLNNAKKIFIALYGKETMHLLDEGLKSSRFMDDFYNANIISWDYLWYVRLYFSVLHKENTNISYLLKVGESEYMYYGTRALAVKLFNTCGGRLIEDRYGWRNTVSGNVLPLDVIKESYE